jgi:hypothetical protein
MPPILGLTSAICGQNFMIFSLKTTILGLSSTRTNFSLRSSRQHIWCPLFLSLSTSSSLPPYSDTFKDIGNFVRHVRCGKVIQRASGASESAGCSEISYLPADGLTFFFFQGCDGIELGSSFIITFVGHQARPGILTPFQSVFPDS